MVKKNKLSHPEANWYYIEKRETFEALLGHPLSPLVLLKMI